MRSLNFDPMIGHSKEKLTKESPIVWFNTLKESVVTAFPIFFSSNRFILIIFFNFQPCLYTVKKFENLIYNFEKFLCSYLYIKFNTTIAHVFGIIRDQHYKFSYFSWFILIQLKQSRWNSQLSAIRIINFK